MLLPGGLKLRFGDFVICGPTLDLFQVTETAPPAPLIDVDRNGGADPDRDECRSGPTELELGRDDKASSYLVWFVIVRASSSTV